MTIIFGYVKQSNKIFLRKQAGSIPCDSDIGILGYYIIAVQLGHRFFTNDPVPVDAIPDIGENQQIVYTEWRGRSPQDIEDQISYPLTTALLGIPGVQTIRSNSIFGVSSIYLIFDEG